MKKENFQLLGLERHKYAPELNKLIFCNMDNTKFHEVPARGVKSLEELQISEEFLHYNFASIEEIDEICNTILGREREIS